MIHEDRLLKYEFLRLILVLDFFMGLRAKFWKISRNGDVTALVELLFLPWGTHSDIYKLRISVNKHVEEGSDFRHRTSFWE